MPHLDPIQIRNASLQLLKHDNRQFSCSFGVQLQSFANVRSGVSGRLRCRTWSVTSACSPASLCIVSSISGSGIRFSSGQLNLTTNGTSLSWLHVLVARSTVVPRPMMPYGEWIGLWSSTRVISTSLSQVKVRPGCPSGTTPQSSSVNRCHANNRMRKRERSPAKL